MSKQISLYVQLDVDLGDHYKLLRLTSKLSEDVQRTSNGHPSDSSDPVQECPCSVHGCPESVITQEQVIGFLYRMWSWALRFSSDEGNLSDLEDRELAVIMRYPGNPQVLREALVEVGFLSDSAIINGWDEIYGKLAAKRKADRERKRQSRGGPMDVQRTSDGSRGNSSVREEKRREDKSNKESLSSSELLI